MPVTLNSTGITFSDGTSLSTVPSSGSTINSAQYTGYTSYYGTYAGQKWGGMNYDTLNAFVNLPIPPSDGLVSDYDFQIRITNFGGDAQNQFDGLRVRTKYRTVS